MENQVTDIQYRKLFKIEDHLIHFRMSESQESHVKIKHMWIVINNLQYYNSFNN